MTQQGMPLHVTVTVARSAIRRQASQSVLAAIRQDQRDCVTEVATGLLPRPALTVGAGNLRE